MKVICVFLALLVFLFIFTYGSVNSGTIAGLPDEILVRFSSQLSDREIEDFASLRGSRIMKKYPLLGLHRLKIAAGRSVEEDMAILNQYPAIEYAEANSLIHENASPDDPGLQYQWGLHNTGENGGIPDADIDAPEAWDIETGNHSAVIAVIDSGIDLDHPDLKDNLYINRKERINGVDDDGNGYVDDLNGWDFINDDNDPSDGRGHGTHVSGIAAASGNNGTGVSGVAWRARVIPLKVLNDCCGVGYISDAIEAILYAIEMKADVINASWSATENSLSLREAIKLAGDAGIIVVAAAGNRSLDNDLTPRYPASYDLPNVVAVAATDMRDTMASFSNFGRRSVDTGAPGLDILSTKPTGYTTFSFGPPPSGLSSDLYGLMSGTSAAAPFVSGAVGLIRAQYPRASVREVRSRILGGVDRKLSLSGRTTSGGRLNAARSLSMNLGKVSGRVMESDGRPVTGAWVVLRDLRRLDRIRTATNTGGHYSFPALPPGRYRVIAGKKGYTRGLATTTLNEGGDAHIDLVINILP